MSVKNKQKLAFLFTSQIYIRNFIENKTLENIIGDENNLLIIQNCTIPDWSNRNHIKLKNLTFIDKFTYSIAEKLKSRLNQHKAKSFKTRIRRERVYFFRILQNHRNYFKKNTLITSIQFLVPLLIHRLGMAKFFISLLSKGKENKDLSKILKKNNINTLIIPSGGAEAEMHYALESCRVSRINSVLIIDNWDNLSSKSVLINKPDRMMVWGEQMAIHAREIQGMKDNQIYRVGCSRFETYYKNEDYKKIIDSPYILFVGMACQYDEKKILKKIDDAISINKKNLKLLYRPHPWQKHLGIIKEEDFNNLVIDPQLKSHYLNKVWRIGFQPDLSYYPSLIYGAELIIGGASTFLIESTIMKKNYIIVAIKEKQKKSIDDSYSILKSYTHLEGIVKYPFIGFCYEYDDIFDSISNVTNKNLSSKDVDQFIEFYAGNNKFKRYEKRFLEAINDPF